MEDCIFCKIIKGEIPSRTVYEDEIIKVIMNINPNTDGHLIIIPKKHYENLFDIDQSIINHSIDIIKEKLYPKLKADLKADGLTIAQNNYYGQEIKHYHLHLIPRYEGDGADFCYEKELTPLEEVAHKLGIE